MAFAHFYMSSYEHASSDLWRSEMSKRAITTSSLLLSCAVLAAPGCGLLGGGEKNGPTLTSQNEQPAICIDKLQLHPSLENETVRLQGKNYDIGELVEAGKREVVERIHAETRRQLGLGVELDRVLFVGGGTVALAKHIANWFPHQAIAEHPAFANARGMLKYLRYVCEASDAA